MNILKAILYCVLFWLFVYSLTYLIFNFQADDLDFRYDKRFFIVGIFEFIGVLFFLFFNDKNPFLYNSFILKYIILSCIIAIVFVITQKGVIFLQETNNLKGFSLSVNIANFSYTQITQIIILPISEELFFRGIIQKKLEEKYNNILAIILSGLLFGALHIFDFTNLFWITIGGLISALIFGISKSVFPSIIFHIVWNLLMLITIINQ